MINDGQPFGMNINSGLPSHFRNEGYDLLFGRRTDLSQISLQIDRQSHFRNDSRTVILEMMIMNIILKRHLDLY